MSRHLCWQAMTLDGAQLPGGSITEGERVRMEIEHHAQASLLQQLFAPQPDASNFWIQDGDSRIEAGSAEFVARTGSMLLHRGLIANLTLRENLLLPFLYHHNTLNLERAEAELEAVTQRIEFPYDLDEKAGERNVYIHAIISLGRCLLMRPDFIIAQEVYIGMPPEHLEQFRQISLQALAESSSGLLYLTASRSESPGIDFSRTIRTGIGAAA